MNLTELKNSSSKELNDMAKTLKVSIKAGLTNAEILLAILRSHSESGGSVTGSGTLEILSDGFGFLRSSKSDYTPTPQDIYVSPSQIRRFRLSTGDDIVGQVRPPRESERYFALLRVKTINSLSAEKATPVPPAAVARAIHTSEKLSIGVCNTRARLFDLLCPIGKGQRVLLLAPPRSQSVNLLLDLAKAAHEQSDKLNLLTLLLAQRPEIISEFQDAKIGPVVSSSFDESPQRHTQVAEMAFENAKRMADAGSNVLILLDSLTRLASAASQNAPSSTVNLPDGLSFKGVQYAKRILSAGRNIEGAGSITLIAILRDAGEPIDDFLRQELSPTANCFVQLSAQAALNGCAMPLTPTSYNNGEDRFLDSEHRDALSQIRRRLHENDLSSALKNLESDLLESNDNEDFLQKLYRQ